MTKQQVPAGETRIEMRVSNSRFIATIAPATTIEKAKEFIQRIKEEYSDASHNVPAFIIGHGTSTVAHCSDDGEPSGTAGRPALAVLKGSGLGDVVIVITRYFGGTKLGTGGLVRAYSDAVREALAAVPIAEKVPTYQARLSIPYSLYEQTKNLIMDYQGLTVDEVFAADITLSIQFRVSLFAGFQEAFRELSHGAYSAQILDSDPDTIMPL